MLSEEDVALALRHDADVAAVKAQALAIAKLEEEERARVLAHGERMKAEMRKLLELRRALRERRRR